MSVTFGSTYSGQTGYDKLTDFIAAAAEALMPEFEAMQKLVTRVDVPRGHDRVRIPFQNNTFAAQSYTDDDEITISQRFSLDTLELTISMLQISYRISERATRLAYVDLGAMAGEELARAQSEKLEVDLLYDATNVGSISTFNAGASLDLTDVRTVLRDLYDVARDPDGGPARLPVYCVIRPASEFDLYGDLGAAVASTSAPRMLTSGGKIEELVFGAGVSSIDQAYIFTILGVPFFRTGYTNMTIGGTTTVATHGSMFSKRAIFLGVSKDWDLKTFDESKYPGLIVRSMTDYGHRVGPFPKWVERVHTS